MTLRFCWSKCFITNYVRTNDEKQMELEKNIFEQMMIGKMALEQMMVQ
jgi:hypothetical protein